MSLLFHAGQRPRAEDIVALAAAPSTAAAPSRFAISHRPADSEAWLELLASGLTFDLSGLAPGPPAALPDRRYTFPASEAELERRLEAVSLVPGAHLRGGEGLVPIVRVTVALAASLAAVPEVVAVAWHPARSWMLPSYFTRTMAAWLDGGAFPALGLTGLAPTPEGGLRSEGLTFFTGQELLLDPRLGDGAAAAKVAVRAIHRLVEAGPLGERAELATGSRSALELYPSADGRTIHLAPVGS